MEKRVQGPADGLAGGMALGRRLFLGATGATAASLLLPEKAQAAVAQGPPYNGRYYGCLSGGDNHTNTLFRRERHTSVRFVAEETGSIASFHWQMRHDGPPPVEYNNGFHSVGWGGNLRAWLRRDRGGVPDMSDAGVITSTNTNDGGSTPLVLRKQETTWTFIRPGAVTRGQVCHLVFVNTHPTDFVSINAHLDNVVAAPPHGHGGPYYGDSWTILHSWRGGPWQDRHHQPFVTFRYTSGQATGCAEDWLDAGALHPVSYEQRARMRFTVQDRSYTAQAVIFRASSRDGRGTFYARLRDLADGRVLRTMTLPASRLPTGSRLTTAVPWTRLPLSAPVVLAQGRTYALEFLCTGSGTCEINATRDGGVAFGFESRNRWLGSRAELSADAGQSWSGWIIRNKGTRPRTDMRMPCAFELA